MKTIEYYKEIQDLVILLKSKNHKIFMEDLEEVMSTYPEHDEAIFMLGHYAYNLGNFPLAMEYFSNAWNLNKQIQEYADAIAITFIALNEKDQAMPYAKTSGLLSPHPYIDHLLDLSIMNYQGLQENDSFAEDFKDVLVNFELGHYYACIDSALKLIHSAKDNHELFLYLGKSYYNLYEYQLAYEALKISYENTDDNYEQLKLLIELSLKLTKIDDFHLYLMLLSKKNKLNDNVSDDIQLEILNHYLEKDPKIQEKIANGYKNKKPIRNNEINNSKYQCNIGILINNRMDKEYLDILLSLARVPIDFAITIFDLDTENLTITRTFDKNGCNYRNLYHENYQSAAMVIRGEGLDILLDATYESSKNSSLIYSYDNIAPCKMSLFDAEVKPQSNALLLTESKSLLQAENVLRLDAFMSFQVPVYERYAQPPIISSNILTLGMIADKRNITPDFLASMGDMLKSSKNIRVIFGYKDFIDPDYKNELISYFDQLNLLDQIFLLEQNNENKRDLQDEFFGYIDVFLNGSKVYPTAIATSLYMGIPVYYVRSGLSNDSIALSILSVMENYDEYVYGDISNCLKDITDIITNQEKLITVRRELIQGIPETLIFNTFKSNLLLYENMFNVSGYLKS